MLASLTLLAVASTFSSPAPIVVDGMLCHPNNLLVKYTNQADLARITSPAKVVRVIPEIHYAVVQAPTGTLQLTRKRIQPLRGISRVDLDRAAKPAYDPNDSMYPGMWNIRAIKADRAWDITKGDPSVVIAVIDTGVNTAHPDLAANIWTNPGEIPGNGIDDDGNGYVDDVNGYDFAYGDAVPNDVQGHGSCCAGIVGAVQDNSIGITGVAPRCKVMALKAALDNGFFYDSANVPAYIYAANNGAKVLSMSFFSDRVSQAERDGIDYCWNHGVLPVAASGNDNTVYSYYPAAYENVLSVAAVDQNLNKAGFSDFGSWVDVSSPGVSLSATTSGGGYTTGFSGTSGACPQVAGIAGLCFSILPGATNAQVRYAIEDTATLQNQAPYGEFSNYGFVNAEAAVQRMLGAAVTPKPSVIRYVAGIRSYPSSNDESHVARIYGRGFGGPNVILLSGDSRVNIAARGRDWIDFYLQNTYGNISVQVDGVVIGQVTFPSNVPFGYPLIEASTQAATLTGGFAQTLKQDASNLTCSRRSDGKILVQATFRKVQPTANMRLTLRRMFTGTTVGTETVQLYDWTSASYPYGSFVTLGSGSVPLSMTTSQFAVPNAGRFVDPEGTMYLLITTSTDLASGATLQLDQAFLEPVP